MIAVEGWLTMEHICRQQGVIAIPGQVTETGRNGSGGFLAAPIDVAAVTATNLEARVVALGLEVDNASDCIRAINGRGTIAQNLDLFDGGQRDGIQINEAGVDTRRVAIVDQATAIQQHEHILFAQAAQRRGGGTLSEGGRIGTGESAGHAGKQCHQFDDGTCTGCFDLFTLDGLYGGGALHRGTLDVGAGHLDLFDLLDFFGSVGKVHGSKRGDAQC